MTTTNKRTFLIAGAAALGLALTACGGGDSDESAETPTSSEATTSASAEPTETESAGDDAAGDASCLVGSWSITAEDAEAQAQALIGDEADITVDGTQSLEIDETTITQISDLTSTFSLEAEGQTISGENVNNSTLSYAYSVSGSELTYDELVSAEGTATISFPGPDGEPQAQEIPVEAGAQALVGIQQPFICSDSELTLTQTLEDQEFATTFTRD